MSKTNYVPKTEAEINQYIQDNTSLIHAMMQPYKSSIKPADYEDVVQECTIEMWRAISDYDPDNAKGADLSTLICNYIKNKLNEIYRSKNAKKRTIDKTAESLNAINNYDDSAADRGVADEKAENPEDIVIRKAEAENIMATAEQILTAIQYNIFVCHINGRTQKEIAEQFGVSQALVSKIVRFSIGKIKEALNVKSSFDKIKEECAREEYEMAQGIAAGENPMETMARLGATCEKYEKYYDMRDKYSA